MKCLILNSPIYRERSNVKEDYLPPLGLGYIASHLKESDVDVDIVDCVKERFGINEIFDLFRQQIPEYIGINIFTQNYETVKEIVEKCPVKATIIIGGQVVKCIYADILQWNVDNELILIIGEGELIIPSILNSTCSEHPIYNNLHKRVDKTSKYFPRDLSAIRLDRSFLRDNIIKNHYNEKEAAIITSRGCIYNCAFCGGAHNLNIDVTIRYSSISYIEHEIRELVVNYPGVTSIRVLDDLFLRDEACINNAIALFGKFYDISWRGMAHILTFIKSLELLPELRQSGCREIFIGIESGSERIRKKINKPGTTKQIENVISAILQSGIDVKGYFMFGFPSETTVDAEATYTLALRLKNISKSTKGIFRTSVFQFRPYHGTQLYKEIIRSGRKMNPISSNDSLNVIDRRSQFNFQSGNYSDIEDYTLNQYILKTQALSEVPNV